ncbi:hypothetical protein CJ030_MR8G028119 [Morella rubra]|uniref:25S rRNA (uridine-N(3))-methyltransferase BMT5-like domain-containing protein n=1 Tax=Morella rubra TaxID=262757 RepID=A0A6A1UVP3_9ROSI|nr:hypothetical protein CJ030_MR8G028119 [Morella rubra]
MGEVRQDKNEGDRWIQHYCSSHQILLVGEGDFSFAASLARKFGDAVNMIATSLDSKDDLIRCYPFAKTNLKELEDCRCSVLHDVDVHTMVSHPLLLSKSFDRIIFNFPHSGFYFKEDHWLQIFFHVRLVSGFFKSAVDMLTENGEIHITHKTANPYSKWEIEKLAEEVGLYLLEKVPFVIFDYPGYVNRRGSGDRKAETFLVGQCSTFKFALNLAGEFIHLV